MVERTCRLIYATTLLYIGFGLFVLTVVLVLCRMVCAWLCRLHLTLETRLFILLASAARYPDDCCCRLLVCRPVVLSLVISLGRCLGALSVRSLVCTDRLRRLVADCRLRVIECCRRTLVRFNIFI